MTSTEVSMPPSEKPKPKYYTEKHKEYMRNYRAKHGSYTEGQKNQFINTTNG